VTKVLLVDDHPMIGAALEMLLRGTDYEFLGRARTVAEGTRELAKTKPDLLLLDVNLPDGSGIDVLAKLHRARSRLRAWFDRAEQRDNPLPLPPRSSGVKADA